MEWITLIGTLSGGILGFTSALLVDWVRARREFYRNLDKMQERIYAEYLVALSETDSALQILAMSKSTPVDRAFVMATFHSKSLLACRFHATLVASEAVVQAVEKSYMKLVDIREAIASSNLTVGGWRWATTQGSKEWITVHLPYRESIDELREVMRLDIRQGSRSMGFRSRRGSLSKI